MKKTRDLQISILLFFAYVAYLLLEGPLNRLLETLSLSPQFQAYLANLLLLLPLLIALYFLLIKLNLEKSLTSKNKRIFLIPAAYLVFTVAMSFNAFSDALSPELLLFLFGLCLVGFTEEFLFRGIIFPKLTTAFSSVYLGAIASSFLFGIGHYINLIGNSEAINTVTSQVIYAFCIGIFMCGLFYKTKNLLVPALIHTILNLDSLIRTWNAVRNNRIPNVGSTQVYHPSLWEALSQEGLFMFFCLTAGLFLIYHQNRKEQGQVEIVT